MDILTRHPDRKAAGKKCRAPPDPKRTSVRVLVVTEEPTEATSSPATLELAERAEERHICVLRRGK